MKTCSWIKLCQRITLEALLQHPWVSDTVTQARQQASIVGSVDVSCTFIFVKFA